MKTPTKTRSKQKKPATRKRAGKTARGRRWSQHVTETSDAMTLEKGVFKQASPRAIATSVKRSAQRSRRRKSEPLRSAISMLTFYINRAGRNLSPTRRKKLTAAKDLLRAEAAHRKER